MPNYRVISSDSHIIEPEDLWDKHIDKEFRERGPRLLHEGENDQWICDGLRFGAIGINQQAGVRFEDPEKLTSQRLDGRQCLKAASTPTPTLKTWTSTAWRQASSTRRKRLPCTECPRPMCCRPPYVPTTTT